MVEIDAGLVGGVEQVSEPDEFIGRGRIDPAQLAEVTAAAQALVQQQAACVLQEQQCVLGPAEDQRHRRRLGRKPGQLSQTVLAVGPQQAPWCDLGQSGDGLFVGRQCGLDCGLLGRHRRPAEEQVPENAGSRDDRLPLQFVAAPAHFLKDVRLGGVLRERPDQGQQCELAHRGARRRGRDAIATGLDGLLQSRGVAGTFEEGARGHAEIAQPPTTRHVVRWRRLHGGPRHLDRFPQDRHVIDLRRVTGRRRAVGSRSRAVSLGQDLQHVAEIAQSAGHLRAAGGTQVHGRTGGRHGFQDRPSVPDPLEQLLVGGAQVGEIGCPLDHVRLGLGDGLAADPHGLTERVQVPCLLEKRAQGDPETGQAAGSVRMTRRRRRDRLPPYLDRLAQRRRRSVSRSPENGRALLGVRSARPHRPFGSSGARHDGGDHCGAAAVRAGHHHQGR